MTEETVVTEEIVVIEETNFDLYRSSTGKRLVM